MDLKTPNYIEKTPFEEPSEDFDLLVSKGVELLQKLTGHSWTDYNYHDPGVTILEQLCFAFTDLSYRTGFDIKDILSDEKGEIPRKKNSFFDKKSILTTNAVTTTDYRKVILDEVEEVDNVDIVPLLSGFSSSYARGFYEIRIKLKDYLAERQQNDPDYVAAIKDKIRGVFVSKRNLSEDLCRKMVIHTPQVIAVHAKILTKEFVHPEEVLLDIYLKIQEYFSPQVRFYSERELLARKVSMEEIYEGPLLKHGILPDSELRSMASEIDLYKLISVASSAKGVLLVQQLDINRRNEKDHGPVFVLEKNTFPVLDPNDFVDKVELYAGDYKLTASKKVFLDLLDKSISLTHFKRDASRHTEEGENIAGGEFKNPGEYISIQENFPHIYGLGKYGVYANEATDRKARVKQLRAYIFFFEQVLANYLAQLENISNFFSTDLEKEGAHSFFYKPLYEIRGAKEIITGESNEDKWETFKKDGTNAYMHCLSQEQETVSDYRRRKHRAFEHIYARFNELFTNYPITAYINAYGDIKGSRSGLLLNWKADVIKNFAETEYRRVHASDYLRKIPQPGGFEEKMMSLLYIPDKSRKRFTDVFETGKIAVVPPKINTQPGDPETRSQSVTWNKENLEIISDTGEITDTGSFGAQSYFFRQEGISVLKYGVSYENYRIGPSLRDENGFIIVYRKPGQDKWRTISRHPDKDSAKLALDKLIAYLLAFSKESEGFHLVEHILLCPPPDTDSFGFRFCKTGNQAELQNHSWTNFSLREEILTELIESAEDEKPNEDAFAPNKNYKDKLLIQEAKPLKEDLKFYADNRMEHHPRFDMLVKTASGKIVSEEFYNMHVTVVFPSWPARFQDNEFRMFVANFFNSAAPAHICFHFQWLGIAKMKVFEDIYFPWLESLREETDRAALSEKLSDLVGRNNYIIRR